MSRSFLACFLIVSSPAILQAQSPHHAEAKNGMVVCVSPPAADAGLAILKQGGNAVDAAVAVAFAEAVTWPEAGNIGGGGFMLIWPGNGQEPVVIDYRETAPGLATVDMFAKSVDFHSHLVVGVPGTVRGLELAHKKYGKLKWKEVVWPAVQLADTGFKVNTPLANSLNRVLTDAKTKNAEFLRVYGSANPSKRWQAGDTLKLPELGKTLRAIAEQGAEAFYAGELAEKLASEMKQGGGLITTADLAKYEAKQRKPIHGTYHGYDVYAPPPPSSGGITLIEMLNMLETFDISRFPRYSPETMHILAEVMRRAYCDRARHLGDQDFVKIPEELTTKKYAKKVASEILMDRVTKSELIAPEIPLKETGGETTHFSVVDGNGMAVANTYTLENAYGSRIVVRGAGYILNNEMTDFNPKPGITPRTGLIGTTANQVAPGKRMLSSMTPTILTKNGKLSLVTGSPGGRTIINTVLCVVVNHVDYRMTPAEAVRAPRSHHQWFPDRIALENREDFEKLKANLTELGHTVIKHNQGDAHTIVFDEKTGRLIGAADPRLDGKAAGY